MPRWTVSLKKDKGNYLDRLKFGFNHVVENKRINNMILIS